jgi:hypothetical protein
VLKSVGYDNNITIKSVGEGIIHLFTYKSNIMTQSIRYKFLFLFSFVGFSSFGQIAQGNWLLGGTGSFSSYTTTFNTLPTSTSSAGSFELKYLDISVSPNIGIFVTNNLALGFKTTYNYLKRESAVSPAFFKISKFDYGPFARIYLFNGLNKFNFLTEIAYQWGDDVYSQTIGTTTSVLYEDLTKRNVFTVLAGPVYFVNPHVGLELLLGYNSTNENYTSSYSNNKSSNNSSGFNVRLGVQVHLGRQGQSQVSAQKTIKLGR